MPVPYAKNGNMSFSSPIYHHNTRRSIGRWRGPGAEKQFLEFSAEETTDKCETTITFRILPGCEWHDAAVELCHYLMMDAGKEPGRGSGAYRTEGRFFQGFSAPGCAAYRYFTGFVADELI